jgi:hypothetical protein
VDHPQPEGNIGFEGPLEEQAVYRFKQIEFEVCPFSSELASLHSDFP